MERTLRRFLKIALPLLEVFSCQPESNCIPIKSINPTSRNPGSRLLAQPTVSVMKMPVERLSNLDANTYHYHPFGD